MKYLPEELGISYVVCKLCNFHCKSLGKHVSNAHGITSQEYQKLYGQVKCSNTREKYSNQNKKNGDWITRANESGKDLTEYKQKMGAIVSESIMSNPEERQRRSELLGKLNKTDEFRKKSSDTAKITSARPEIQKQRAEQLKKWREENPKDFFEKCVRKFSCSFQSIPESLLRALLIETFPDYEFSTGLLESKEFFKITKDNKRQIDILSEKMKIAIEYDGRYHFNDSESKLTNTKLKDIELNEALPKMNYLLIRISYDQYKYDEFKEECLKQLFDTLINPKPGLVKIGSLYETV